jgi:hypothetical protein
MNKLLSVSLISLAMLTLAGCGPYNGDPTLNNIQYLNAANVDHPPGDTSDKSAAHAHRTGGGDAHAAAASHSSGSHSSGSHDR